MRIVFCITDGANAINGINAWLLGFLPALQGRGHEVRVLAFPWSPPSQCVTIPRLIELGIPVEGVYPPRYTEGAIRSCFDYVRAHRPDVFVANMVVPALFASGALRRRGTPTVAAFHSDDAEYHAKRDLFLQGDPAWRVSAGVAVSRGLLDRLGTAPAGLLIRYIPYGVPISATIAERKPGQRLRLLYFGRIVQAQKRIFETLTALVRICRRFENVEADLYGSGPEARAAANLLAQDNAGGRVQLKGRLDPSQVQELLPQYHVAVLLSDFEGLPVSLLEAMSAGLVPVYLRPASGPAVPVESGVNGILVSNRDDDFDAAIARLNGDDAERQRLAAGARETIRRKFSSEATLNAWEDLLREVAASRESPAPAAEARRPLPTVKAALALQDVRFPGWPQALWRRLRFPHRPRSLRGLLG